MPLKNLAVREGYLQFTLYFSAKKGKKLRAELAKTRFRKTFAQLLEEEERVRDGLFHILSSKNQIFIGETGLGFPRIRVCAPHR